MNKTAKRINDGKKYRQTTIQMKKIEKNTSFGKSFTFFFMLNTIINKLCLLGRIVYWFSISIHVICLFRCLFFSLFLFRHQHPVKIIAPMNLFAMALFFVALTGKVRFPTELWPNDTGALQRGMTQLFSIAIPKTSTKRIEND